MGNADDERLYNQPQPVQEGQPPLPDNWEASFEGMLHAAIETLFTYRPIAERLAGIDKKAVQGLVHERKLEIVERLRDTAWEEVMDLVIDLGQVQVREPALQVTTQNSLQIGRSHRKETALKTAEATDPHAIAWNLVEHWKEALQQLGQMPRVSDLAKDEEFDDYHDELNRLYRQVCHQLGLPWPPPVSDVMAD